MLECDYEVKQIDGDYAHLQRIDRPEEELKLVARALLPIEIYEGCIAGSGVVCNALRKTSGESYGTVLLQPYE